MICSPRPESAASQTAGGTRGARPSLPAAAQSSPYGLHFWRAYLANTAVMIAIALLFRYADFVTLTGGTELHLGWIVGVGMVGSLLMRVFLGTWIDHYGPRLVWLCALAVFAASCFGHVAVHRYNSPAVYLLRIAFCSAIAGVFGSSMTFISARAPAARMAEMIGMLGTSGFVGIVVGTQLGDLLLGTPTIQRWQVDRMFLVAGTLGICAMMFAWGATRDQPPPARRRRPPLVWLLRRYHPGTVVLVGIASGVGLGLPATFLRTYAAELDIPRIGLFFGAYAPTAILTRILTRRLPERLGLPQMILIGLGLVILGQLLLLIVGSERLFIVPAIGYGMGHAILFPTTVAAGVQGFPSRYRGLGTTLMLATYDVGNLVGAPAAGAMVHFSAAVGLPGYPTMFVSVAAMLGLVGLAYGLSAREPGRQRPTIRRQAGTSSFEQRDRPPIAEAATEA